MMMIHVWQAFAANDTAGENLGCSYRAFTKEQDAFDSAAGFLREYAGSEAQVVHVHGGFNGCVGQVEAIEPGGALIAFARIQKHVLPNPKQEPTFDPTQYESTLRALFAILTQANAADSDQAERWQHADDASQFDGFYGHIWKAIESIAGRAILDHRAETGEVVMALRNREVDYGAWLAQEQRRQRGA